MIKGVISPSIVLFQKDGGVDYEKSKSHMDWMLRNGVNGLFVTGTYGSGYLLSPNERTKLYKIAKRLTEGHSGTFVIAHTGCVDTASTVALTKAAAETGIGAVSAISPLIYGYTDTDVWRYYDAIQSASDAVVFAYNNPGVTGYALSADLIDRLKSLGLAGIKDSSADKALAKRCCVGVEPSFQYITGTTTDWPEMKNIGVKAMIAGMCNYLPEFAVGLFNAAFENEDKANRIYELVKSAGGKLKFGNSLVSSHICLKSREMDAGYMRAPLCADYDALADGMKRAKAAIEDAFVEFGRISS